MNYYNEWDKPTAAWLRELIKEGLIPKGEVDERSITDVTPNDVRGFTQCHWFAGIGGWPYALRLAGWPEDRPVWTGSCPCQPFSCAGKGEAQADERHLWPSFFELIQRCRPVTVFGEQVADAIGKGWLDGISTDLERADYTCGASVLGAHSVSAPHKRRRLYWVANSKQSRRAPTWIGLEINAGSEFEQGRALGSMGESNSTGRSQRQLAATTAGHRNPIEPAGFWHDSTWHPCRDNKLRRIPTQSALFPLADGIPYRVARRRTVRPPLLRGAGNAIVPQVAQIFIEAFLDL